MSEGSEGVPVRLVVDLVVAPGYPWVTTTVRALLVDQLRSYTAAGLLVSAQVVPAPALTAGEALEEARRGVPEGAPNGRYMHLPPEEALDVRVGRDGHGGEPSLRADAAAYLHDFEMAMAPFDNNGYADVDEAPWLKPMRALGSLVSCLVDLHPEESA